MKQSIFLKRLSPPGWTSRTLLRVFQSAVIVVFTAGIGGGTTSVLLAESVEQSDVGAAIVRPSEGNTTPKKTETDEAQGKDSKKKKTDKKSKKDRKKRKDKKNTLEVPIPINHTAAGIKLPDFDDEGKLKMTFEIGSAFRKDEMLLELKDLIIETYGDDEKIDMRIKMPASTFNLDTRVLISTPAEHPVVIRRDDIEVTGKRMTFDTKTRKGRFIGATKVVILDRDNFNLSEDKNENKEK